MDLSKAIFLTHKDFNKVGLHSKQTYSIFKQGKKETFVFRVMHYFNSNFGGRLIGTIAVTICDCLIFL